MNLQLWRDLEKGVWSLQDEAGTILKSSESIDVIINYKRMMIKLQEQRKKNENYSKHTTTNRII